MTAIVRDEDTQRAIASNATNAEIRLVDMFMSAGATEAQARNMIKFYGSAIGSNNSLFNQRSSGSTQGAKRD